MRYYELTYLISPDLSSEQLDSLREKIILFIQAEKGVLIEQIKTDKKNLAYQIKKRGGAYLMTLDFQLNPESIKNLERTLKEEPQILRYLILTKKMPKVARAIKKPSKFPKKIVKPKVELKEIEKKLEEILGE